MQNRESLFQKFGLFSHFFPKFVQDFSVAFLINLFSEMWEGASSASIDILFPGHTGKSTVKMMGGCSGKFKNSFITLPSSP